MNEKQEHHEVVDERRICFFEIQDENNVKTFERSNVQTFNNNPFNPLIYSVERKYINHVGTLSLRCADLCSPAVGIS